MKYPWFAVIVVLCYSCDSSTFTGAATSDLKKMEIYLTDSLGIITVSVPLRYDTSFSWVHYSDCNTCHLQKYRVQNQKTPILYESGFYWNEPKDSVDRFTITHNEYLLNHGDDTAIIFSRHSHFKHDLSFTRKGMKILKDTIRKINDRYFSIFELDNSDVISKKEVLAITTINGNFIYFSCELMGGKPDTLARYFFSNSTELINSIHIASVK